MSHEQYSTDRCISSKILENLVRRSCRFERLFNLVSSDTENVRAISADSFALTRGLVSIKSISVPISFAIAKFFLSLDDPSAG